MGEQADYQLDQYLDSLGMEDDGMGPEDGDGPPLSFKTCRCCGTKGLFWGRFGPPWRLVGEDGKIHACKVKPLPAKVEPREPCETVDPVEKAFRAGFNKGYGTFSYQEGGDPRDVSQEKAWKEYRKS